MKPNLDEAQRAAVFCTDRLVFIEAGPGTGKTTVAVERFGLYRFVRTNALEGEVLALAFTRSVTSEFRDRVRLRWGEGALAGKRGSVSTIDAEFVRVLQFLRANDLISWPGNPETITPINSWDESEIAKFNWSKWKPSAFRVAVQGNTVTAIADPDHVGAMYVSKKDLEEKLRAGVCTHADVRHVVIAVCADDNVKARVTDWLGQRVAHLIVDEVFDADADDLHLIGLYQHAGVATTVIGDPWQALYEWRKPVPEDVRAVLVGMGFTPLELANSRRFAGAMVELTSTLRGGATALPPPCPDYERPVVVLASTWRQLWALPDWVLPLAANGRITSLSAAFVALLIDDIAQLRLRAPSPVRADAVRRIFEAEDEGTRWTSDFESVKEALLLNGPTDGLAALRDTKLGGRQPGRLGDTKEAALIELMSDIARRLRCDSPSTPGLSVHNAKGCEWDHVGVSLTERDRNALANGLDVNEPMDRVVFVALTRAKHTTVLVEPLAPDGGIP